MPLDVTAPNHNTHPNLSTDSGVSSSNATEDRCITCYEDFIGKFKGRKVYTKCGQCLCVDCWVKLPNPNKCIYCRNIDTPYLLSQELKNIVIGETNNSDEFRNRIINAPNTEAFFCAKGELDKIKEAIESNKDLLNDSIVFSDPNNAKSNKKPLLFLALRYQHMEIVNYILAARNNMEGVNSASNFVIYAPENNEEKNRYICEIFLHYYPGDLSSEHLYGYSILDHLIRYYCDVNNMQLLDNLINKIGNNPQNNKNLLTYIIKTIPQKVKEIISRHQNLEIHLLNKENIDYFIDLSIAESNVDILKLLVQDNYDRESQVMYMFDYDYDIDGNYIEQENLTFKGDSEAKLKSKLAESSNYKTTRTIVEALTNISCCNKKETQLHEAMMVGNLETAKKLIDLGCSIYTPNADGKTALECGVLDNTDRIIRYSTNNFNETMFFPRNAIDESSKFAVLSNLLIKTNNKASFKELIGKLQEYEANQIRDVKNNSSDFIEEVTAKQVISKLILRAILHRNNNNLEYILKELDGRYYINLCTKINGINMPNTPLGLASQIGNATAVKLLLTFGARVEATDEKISKYRHKNIEIPFQTCCLKYVPKEQAIINGHLEVLELLLTAGDSLNINGFNKKTPMHYAFCNPNNIGKPNLDMINYMLNKKAKLDNTSIIDDFIRHHDLPHDICYNERVLNALETKNECLIQALFILACIYDNSFLAKNLFDFKLVKIDIFILQTAFRYKSYQALNVLVESGYDIISLLNNDEHTKKLAHEKLSTINEDTPLYHAILQTL